MPYGGVEGAVRPAEVKGPIEGRAAEVLTPEALALVAELHHRLNARRLELLQARLDRQVHALGGELLFRLAVHTLGLEP